MEIRPDQKLRRIHEHIRFYFDFLFRRGFNIVSMMFIDENNESWQVMLQAQNCLVKIHSDKGKVNLTLSTQQSKNEINLFDLVDVIQHMNGGVEFFHLVNETELDEMQRLKRTAWLLEKYIDDILVQIKRNSLFSINRLLFSYLIEKNRMIV